MRPLLDLQGRVATGKCDYVRATLEHLQKATAAEWRPCRPKHFVERQGKDLDSITDLMLARWNTINPNKSCGCDGVHPSWIKLFDTNKADDNFKVGVILKSSLL